MVLNNLINSYIPVQRGNVKIENLTLINAVLYVAENGVLERLFLALQKEKLIQISVICLGLDSTSIKVHQMRQAILKKGPQSIGKSRGGWTTKIHMVAANDRLGLIFSLSPGQADDGQSGQHLLKNWEHPFSKIPLAMDRTYEGKETCQCVENSGFEPVAPPKSNRLEPWIYDKTTYKRHNEIERLFRRLKGFRRIFS